MLVGPFIDIEAAQAQAAAVQIIDDLHPQGAGVIDGVDVAIVNGGFAGVYAEHGAVRHDRRHAVAVRGDAIGGRGIDPHFIERRF